jgi:hypothetical protein
LTKFKHHKINIYIYLLIMRTISIFILLIYWSIMIFAPVMSKDIKMSQAKKDEITTMPISKVIR